MRIQFYLYLIVATLPYLATACDKDCTIEASTGIATGCGISETAAGALVGAACGAAIWFDFGISCALAIAGTGSLIGGCHLIESDDFISGSKEYNNTNFLNIKFIQY